MLICAALVLYVSVDGCICDTSTSWTEVEYHKLYFIIMSTSEVGKILKYLLEEPDQQYGTPHT